jgi:hypothetical protein
VEVFRRAVIPVASGFAVFVAMALRARRMPSDERPPAAIDARALIWVQAVTIVAGYLLFLLLVLVFHVLNAGQTRAMQSAAKGGGFLAFCVAAPLLIVGSLVAVRPGQGPKHRRK